LAQTGFVKSGDQAIPGAVVTAKQDSRTISAVTDQSGRYAFSPLGPGIWKLTVEMFGFETLAKDVDYSAAKGPVNFDLRLKESAFVKRLQQCTWTSKSQSKRAAVRPRVTKRAYFTTAKLDTSAASEWSK
jgi:hypothetical protein